MSARSSDEVAELAAVRAVDHPGVRSRRAAPPRGGARRPSSSRQPACWWIASSSTNGTASDRRKRRADVVLPLPLAEARIATRFTDEQHCPPVHRIRAVRLVYAFDEEAPGGRELLGGKGVGLAEMTALGVPVPGRVHDHDRRLPRDDGARARCRRSSGPRSTSTSRGSRSGPGSASATRPTRSSSPCARAPPSRCRG